MFQLLKCSFDSNVCLLKIPGSHSITLNIVYSSNGKFAGVSSFCWLFFSLFLSLHLTYLLFLFYVGFCFLPLSWVSCITHLFVLCYKAWLIELYFHPATVSFISSFSPFVFLVPIPDRLLERHRQARVGPEWKRSVQWQLGDGEPDCSCDHHHGNVPSDCFQLYIVWIMCNCQCKGTASPNLCLPN